MHVTNVSKCHLSTVGIVLESISGSIASDIFGNFNNFQVEAQKCFGIFLQHPLLFFYFSLHDVYSM